MINATFSVFINHIIIIILITKFLIYEQNMG